MTTQRDPYELFRRDEAAEYLRINMSHLSKLTREKRIYSVRIGRRVLYPRAALEAFIRGEHYDGDGRWPGTDAMIPATDLPRGKRDGRAR